MLVERRGTNGLKAAGQVGKTYSTLPEGSRSFGGFRLP
jgi:hypothetical protein